MSKRGTLLESLQLQGLELAPSQVWGSVRIVPVLRPDAPGDLRLTRRDYDADLGIVALAGDAGDPTNRAPAYFSYIPHGLVVRWSADGTPAAAFGASLFGRDGQRIGASGGLGVRILSRMVRREDRDRLRLLPLHLAMEGFLALHFGGPDVAWEEYSRHALSYGLAPRLEMAVPGAAIRGLDEALRVFEMHRGQVGALVFVADALASAFVTSHPDDYRALHASLIQDFFGELIWQYGCLYAGVGEIGPNAAALAAEVEVREFDDLRAIVARMRAEWNDTQVVMADEVFDRPVASEVCYELGPFTLQRFMTDLAPGNNNHIGECILNKNGTVEYLKTFRLSAAQSRRAYLLKNLAGHGWNIAAFAESENTTKDQMILRLAKAGFAYLLRPDVIAWAMAQARKRRNR